MVETAARTEYWRGGASQMLNWIVANPPTPIPPAPPAPGDPPA